MHRWRGRSRAGANSAATTLWSFRSSTLARIDRSATFKALYMVGYRSCERLLYFLPKGKSRAWILLRSGRLEPLFRPG